MKSSFFIAAIILFSCNQTVTNKKCDTNPQMYKSSEMATLMNRMYDINDSVRTLLLNGIIPNILPEEFRNIQNAKLTDESDRDESFKTFAKLYIENTKEQYSSKTIEEAKSNYTKTINTCISCHQTHCGGPVEKIMKLTL